MGNTVTLTLGEVRLGEVALKPGSLASGFWRLLELIWRSCSSFIVPSAAHWLVLMILDRVQSVQRLCEVRLCLMDGHAELV